MFFYEKAVFFGEDTEVFDLNLNHTQTIILDPQIRGQKMSFASKGNDAFYITNPLGNVVHLVDLDGKIVQEKGLLTTPSGIYIAGSSQDYCL